MPNNKPTYKELQKRVRELEQAAKDRDQVHKALQESDSIYKTMLDGISSSIVLIDENGVIIHVNKAWLVFAEENGAFPNSVAEGTNYLSVCNEADGEHADEALPFAKGIRAVLQGKKSRYSLEYPCHSPEQQRWFQAIVSPLTVNNTECCAIVIHVNITERKLAEKALRKSDEKHRLLFESMVLGIVYQDTAGAIISANPAAEKILGLSLDQMQGRTLMDSSWKAIHEDGSDFPEDARPAAIALKTGEPVRDVVMGIFPPHAKDCRWINVNAIPQFKPDENTPFQVYIIIDDITERKNIEKELHLSKERQKKSMQALMDNIPGFAFIKDINLYYMSANNTFCDLLNIPYDQIYGKTDYDIFPKDLAAKYITDDKKVIESGEPLFTEEETINKNKDGRRFVVATRKLPWRDENDRIIGVYGLGFDISELKWAEEELRKLMRAIEQSPSIIIITDSSGVIEYVNPAFYSTTGYTAAETIGGKPNILKSEYHDEPFYQDLWETISSGDVWKGEFYNKKKDGNLFWQQAAISPVVNEKGDIVHYVGIQEDITQKKELEHLKEEVERIMRHDLKQPLSSIIGYPQLLMATASLTDIQKQYCQNIELAGQQMLDMIDFNLNIIKLEAGSFKFSPVPINITELINRIFIDLNFIFKAKNISSVLKINQKSGDAAQQQVIIQGEETLSYRLFSNLIKNAAEASPNNEIIQVDISETPSSVVIRIRNQGVVPAEIRNVFFEKYVTYGKNNGTGLGTYSAKLMTESQGGTISMQTEEGKGTMVTINFPVFSG